MSLIGVISLVQVRFGIFSPRNRANSAKNSTNIADAAIPSSTSSGDAGITGSAQSQ